jgi:hypothetical protein
VKYGRDFVSPKVAVVAMKTLQEPRKDTITGSGKDTPKKLVMDKIQYIL